MNSNTFIKNICTNCYQHPFICILLPCFPYIIYQNFASNYQLKIDDDDYDYEYDDNDGSEKSTNEWIDIEKNDNNVISRV